MSRLLHIAEGQAWAAAAQGAFYRPESLEREGFIHCSSSQQVVAVANDLYRGRQDMVLLVINADKVPAEIRYEDCYESGQAFPHIYGPLPIEAVEQTIAFEPGPDGRFILPLSVDEDGLASADARSRVRDK